jgi:anti-sigma regulatory factor (Ser/Thr protein kinase)
MEATVTLILREDGDISGTEPSGGVGFPLVGEAVDVVEFDTTVGVNEVTKHAASTDGGELAGITHHHHPPRPLVG